ncbi:MAG TPA: tyrosine-type recombinase/integrase [Vicinamibacterales bacterium]|nr:tyrosine-type recombinase/integrase [Vicinamibacterales bacterium]
MAIETLTPKRVAAVQPDARRMELGDTVIPGLWLRVAPTGVKTWAVRYRHRGRTCRFTLGSTKVLSLAEARERARTILRSATDDRDPAREKQQARRAQTVDDLAALYIEKWAKARKKSWKADDNLLRRKILPSWRHRSIAEITRHDVIVLVESIAAQGAPVVANRVTALVSKMFAFALDRGLISVSPAVRIPRPCVERARDRVLSDDELRRLWAACETLPGPMAAFYRLRLLTAQRGGELAALRWQDVDLVNRWLTIPGPVAKNGLAHRVPVNDTAHAILTGLRADADRILAARHARGDSRPKPIAFVLDGALGKRQQAEATASFGIEDFRGHDLRRTAASRMTSGGIPRLVVGKILNHREGGVTAVYDRHSYDAEKVAALTWWDHKLQAILTDEAARVLPFARIGLSA